MLIGLQPRTMLSTLERNTLARAKRGDPVRIKTPDKVYYRGVCMGYLATVSVGRTQEGVLARAATGGPWMVDAEL